jgi:hypothetical protein
MHLIREKITSGGEKEKVEPLVASSTFQFEWGKLPACQFCGVSFQLANFVG